MRNLVPFMIVPFLFLSCGGTKKRQHLDCAYTCKLDKMDWDGESLDAENVEYIPLETSDSSLIGHIDKVLYRNGHFYIFDYYGKKVLVFDREGKYEYQVKRHGEGPGEYVKAMDMDVDGRGNVYVYDIMRRQVLKYYPQSGGYDIYKVGTCINFCMLGDSLIALGNVYEKGMICSRLSLYSMTDSSVKHVLLPEYDVDEFKLMNAGTILYRSGDKVFAYNRFAPYIYGLGEAGKLEAYLEIVSDKYLSESRAKELVKGDVRDYITEEGCIKNIMDIFDTEEHFICKLEIVPSPGYLVLAKKTGKFAFLKFDGRIRGQSNVLGVDGDKFITAISYEDSMAKKYKDLLGFDFSEDDNPVLCLFEIR